MTLVLAITRKDSIWLLADRRLSRGTRTTKEDARKITFLETTDGVAILGYAGLGITAFGTEPSEWMNAVLRGRNVSLEVALKILAAAIHEQMPQHLVEFPGVTHGVLVPAFVNEEVRLYTVDLVRHPNRNGFECRCVRHFAKGPHSTGLAPPPVMFGGSGARTAQRERNTSRALLSLANAHDRCLVSPYLITDRLAALNNQVHLTMADRTVGDRCIVAWRYRKKGIHKGGGGHQFYTGARRDSDSTVLPTVITGINVSGLVKLLTPSLNRSMAALMSGEPVPDDRDEMKALLADLANTPDEELR